MKNLNYFASVLLVCLIFLGLASNAQSESYAAGEILVEYDPAKGELQCASQRSYTFTFKFYRDCFFNAPFANSKTLLLRTEKTNGTSYGTTKKHKNPPIQITVTRFGARGQDDGPPCLTSPQPSCTEYQYYISNKILLPQRDDWVVQYAEQPLFPPNAPLNGIQFFSQGTENVERKSTFATLSKFTTLCLVSKTDGSGDPKFTSWTAPGDNTPAIWNNPHPIFPFCDGTPQEFKLRVLDNDQTLLIKRINNPTNDPNAGKHQTIIGSELVKDRLVFSITATRKDGAGNTGRPVEYASGFSSSVPFPVKPPDFINVFSALKLDSNTGVLSFTPDLSVLGKNVSSFTGVFTIKVTERRPYYKEVLNNGIIELQLAERTINETFRDIRINIDKRCNTVQPSFTAPNAVLNSDSRWEFDCASSEFVFDVSDPMFESSLHAKDETPGFRMYRVDPNGNPLESIDKNSYDITVRAIDANVFGQFNRFAISTVQDIGPGNYSIVTKKGDDGNTMINECGQEINENIVIPITVNTDYTYIFEGDDPIKICWDAEAAEIRPFDGKTNRETNQLLNDAFITRYSYRGPSFNATVQWTDQRRASDGDLSVYNFEHRFVDLTDFPEGWWTIEVVRNFPWSRPGASKLNDEFCADDDRTVFVESFNVPEVVIDDIELCPDEDWPVIDLRDHPDLLNATDFRWEFTQRQPNGLPPKTIPIGGNSNSQIRNDTLDVGEVAFGSDGEFELAVGFTINDCVVDPIPFKVRRERVIVDLDGMDSTICPGEQYPMNNTITYKAPDLMTYQWYLNNQAIPGATSPSQMNSERGRYKLEITKTTENSFCKSADSIFINVADKLIAPEVECIEVTYKDGEVRQHFFWPLVEGTDFMQVRGVDRFGNLRDENDLVVTNDTSGWHLTNGLYDLYHWISGQQYKLQARSVNTEVGPEAVCRYGPIGVGESCNIVIDRLNVFTPNGDGTNDFLRFDLLEIYPSSKLQIFNRWGELIYENNDYKNDWDGGDYEDGVYFYLLDINDESQGLIKGSVTLLR